MNNMFCLIDSGIIYQVDNYGTKSAIGYTNEEYNNLQETTTEYYNKLVELGVIIPPKSQEEINSELQQTLRESQEMNIQLMKLIKDLKGGTTDEQNDDTTDKKDVSK